MQKVNAHNHRGHQTFYNYKSVQQFYLTYSNGTSDVAQCWQFGSRCCHELQMPCTAVDTLESLIPDNICFSTSDTEEPGSIITSDLTSPNSPHTMAAFDLVVATVATLRWRLTVEAGAPAASGRCPLAVSLLTLPGQVTLPVAYEATATFRTLVAVGTHALNVFHTVAVKSSASALDQCWRTQRRRRKGCNLLRQLFNLLL